MIQFVSDSLLRLSESFKYLKRARLILFYISLSPVFLTPILFIYLEQELKLNLSDVLRITAYYQLVSMALDIPMGICADRFGVKSTLYGGLISYIAAIASLVTLPNAWAYQIYCLFYNIGFPCISGADMSLIRQHWGSEDGSFKSHMFSLQKWAYLTNACLFLFTPLIYFAEKKLPFLLQIGLLILSMLNLLGLRAQKNRSRPKGQRLFSDFALAVRLCLFNRKYFLLLVCSSVFGLGISINQKVIQHQLMSHMQLGQQCMDMVKLGLIYAATSLSSALGTSGLAVGLRSAALSRQILILLGMLILAFLLMGISNFEAIVAGFLLINLFKGGFRPLINAELTNQMPFQRLTAQTLSFTSFVSAFFLIQMQLGLSCIYSNPARGNLFYAGVAATCILSALAYASWPYTWQVAEQRSRGRRKRALICENGTYQVMQFYPRATSRKSLQQLIAASELSIYPAPISSWHQVHQGYCVKTPFLGDVTLAQIRDGARQKTLCRELLASHRKSHCLKHPAKSLAGNAVFEGETLAKVQKTPFFQLRCDIHGQLRPANVLVVNRECRVVKWGACGTGEWWWDVFTLLTHPDLHISARERIALIGHFSECSSEFSGELLGQFCRFRAEKILQSALLETEARELSNRYLRIGENRNSV